MTAIRLVLSTVILMIISTLPSHFALGLPWPLDPSDSQHQVTATFGEFRVPSGSNPPFNEDHFHDGVDMYAPYETYVYSVEPESIWAINTVYHYIQTQYHDYRHIVPFYLLEVGDSVEQGTFLGYTIDYNNDGNTNNDHLHFTSENDQMNGSFHYGYEYNPLLQSLGSWYALQPFSDTHDAVIHWIKVVKDETIQEFAGNVIKDSVDILVKATDNTSFPGGVDYNNGSYSVGYYIGGVGFWNYNIEFDCWTSYWDIDYVYASGSNNTTYKYVATNDMNYNDFWSTHEVSDGYYTIYVEVCDQSDNCVQDSIAVRVWNSTEVEDEQEEKGRELL